jgi:superfamily II DNA/RNA helicase
MRAVLDGAAVMIPPKYHGTTTSIVRHYELGLPSVDFAGYATQALPPGCDRLPVQILVFTLLAKYQERMIEYLGSCGIRATNVNGHMSPPEREERIRQFKNDPTLTVLIMSGIGTTGLNLTNATLVVLYVCAQPKRFRPNR